AVYARPTFSDNRSILKKPHRDVGIERAQGRHIELTAPDREAQALGVRPRDETLLQTAFDRSPASASEGRQIMAAALIDGLKLTAAAHRRPTLKGTRESRVHEQRLRVRPYRDRRHGRLLARLRRACGHQDA